MTTDTPERPAEGPVIRFLRWLIEPPVRPQSTKMRVLRQALRALGFVLRALVGDGTGDRCG